MITVICPTCKSTNYTDNSSLHGWDRTFDCGYQIIGVLGSDEFAENYSCGEKPFVLPTPKEKIYENTIDGLIFKYTNRLDMRKKLGLGVGLAEQFIEDLEKLKEK